MISQIQSAELRGTEGRAVVVEGATENGRPSMILTGLVSQGIRESQERIKVALKRLGFEVPKNRLLLHLHPPDRPKCGSHWDLPLALVSLAAEGMGGLQLSRCGAVGTLGLSGEVGPVKGALALAQALVQCDDLEHILVPLGNPEIALLNDPRLCWVSSLAEAVGVLRGTAMPRACPRIPQGPQGTTGSTLDRIRGQVFAKRTLEVALAGRHSTLWVGPPGVGKTFLAECARELLPPLSPRERIEVIKAAGPKERNRPFRTPHHTIPAQRLLGGGSGQIVPGEVTLAHLGVLFLDEIGEFRRDALEGLREPLQSGVIHVHRGTMRCCLPAQFTLIAAMNPCPCGFSLGGARRCDCLPREVSRYRRRLSGPLRDRFDMVAVMGQGGDTVGDAQEEIRARIHRAWEVQERRWQSLRRNNEMSAKERENVLKEEASHRWMERWEGGSHPRTRSKLLMVARTLADLAGEKEVGTTHLEEAWLLRESQRNWEEFAISS